MNIYKIAAQLIIEAATPLKVLSVGRRGVTIGVGKPVEVPSLISEAKGERQPEKPTHDYAKKLFWDAEKHTWSYIYLSKGLPPRGEVIGIGERGKVAYYKVTRSSPTLIELQLEKKYLPKGAEGTFVEKLTFDENTIQKLRSPTWFRTVSLGSDKHVEKIKQLPTLKGMFAEAEALAKNAYSAYAKEKPEEAGRETGFMQYTKAYNEYNNMVGYQMAYKGINQFLDSMTGDERTIAAIRKHVDGELEDIDGYINKQKSKLDELHQALPKDQQAQTQQHQQQKAASVLRRKWRR